MAVCSKCGSEISVEGGLCPNCLFNISNASVGPKSTTLLLPADHSGAAFGDSGRFGDYELLGVIAQGGMGVVYRARQRSLNRTVALKMILPGQLASTSAVQRFQLEAEAVAMLEHPNIVPIYEIGEHEGRHFFSMRLIEGGSLANGMAKLGFPQAVAAADNRAALRHRQKAIARLVAVVARAVHYAHQRGVLHRDLKPGNILLDLEGQPHVTDFGLAKVLTQDASLTQSMAVIGTPAYMAPEQALSGTKQISTAADLHSLGVILYELLTGRPPYCGESVPEILRKLIEDDPKPPRAVHKEVDSDLETICLKCLEKSPSDRYPSGQALAEDLERWSAGQPIQARPVTRAEKLWRWCRREPALASLSAGLLLVLLATAIGSSLAASKLRERLRASLLAQVRSERVSRELPRLDLLRQAAKLRIGPDLRNEAAACLNLQIQKVEVPFRPEYARFSSDLWHFATKQTQTNVSVHETKGGQLIRSFPSPGLRVARILFSRDDKLIAVNYKPLSGQSSPDLVELWPVAVGSARRASIPVTNSVEFLEFTSDNKFLAVATKSAQLLLYDVTTGGYVRTIPTRALNVVHLALSPTGDRFAQWDSFSLNIRPMADGPNIEQSFPHPQNVADVSWHPDGRHLASACGNSVYIFDLDNPKKRLEVRHSDIGSLEQVIDVEFSHDGSTLCSTSFDGVVVLWDFSSELVTFKTRFTDPETAELGRLKFSRDDHFLIKESGSALFDIAQSERVLHIERGKPEHVRIANPGLLAFGGEAVVQLQTDALKVWRQTDGKELATIFCPKAESFAFDEVSSNLFLNGSAGLRRSHFWSPAPGALTLGQPAEFGSFKSKGEPRELYEVKTSADGRRVAAICRQNREHAHIFDAVTGSELAQTGYQQEMSTLALSPNGEWIATATILGVGPVRIWRADSGRLATELPPQGQAGLLFSGDGRWLLTNMRTNAVLWEVGTWSKRWSHSRSTSGQGMVEQPAFSFDSRFLACTVSRSRVLLVDLTTFAELVELEVPALEQWPICSLSFSPDTSQLLATGGPHFFHVWDLGRLRSRLSELKLDWDAPQLPLRNASPHLRVELADAQPTFERVGGRADMAQRIHKRDAGAPTRLLNLEKFYTGLLEEEWHGPEAGVGTNNASFGCIPLGTQRMAGKDFDVRGLIRSSHLKGGTNLPDEVIGMPVNRLCSSVHFLHGVLGRAAEGAEVSRYRIHYRDASVVDLDVRYGENVRSWWRRDDSNSRLTNGCLSWAGTNAVGLAVQVFTSRWVNPRPEMEIVSIDFVSVLPELVPFLVAITVDDTTVL